MTNPNKFRLIDGDLSPVADIRIGPTQRLKIYGHSDLRPPLVEVVAPAIFGEHLHLKVEQAEAIAAALIEAARKARG